MSFMSEVGYDHGFKDGIDKMTDFVNSLISDYESKGVEPETRYILLSLKSKINEINSWKDKIEFMP